MEWRVDRIPSAPGIADYWRTSIHAWPRTCARARCDWGSARKPRGYYRLRWRILERMRRFLRPSFRRPLPVLFVPTHGSVELQTAQVLAGATPKPRPTRVPQAGHAKNPW